MIYDVIIIGAGPAGTNTAFYLGESGFKTLILDKCSFPRVKVCAGGLPYHIKDYGLDIDDIIECKSDSAIFSYKGKDKIILKFNNFTIDMVMRHNFDYYLLNRAIKENAIFNSDEIFLKGEFENDLISITTNKNIYKTKYLVGADGACSSVNKFFNIIRKDNLGITINAEVEVTEERKRRQGRNISLDLGKVDMGYSWIFPKKNHLSIGIGAAKNKFKNFKKFFFRNLKYLDINDDDIIKIRMIKGHALPFFSEEEKLNKKNVLLVGDAANLVDALSGEGIYYAMKSGELAANSIIQTETNNIDIDCYNDLIRKTILTDLTYSKKFADLFFKYPKISYILGIKNNDVSSLFLEMLIGKRSYKDLYIELQKKYSAKFNFLKKHIFKQDF